jgi:hypothetical protein
MSTLLQSLAGYRCVDGLVHNRWVEAGERNPSGNGLAYSCATAIGMKLRGEWTGNEREDLRFAILRCEAVGRPGLFRRGPFHPAQEGPDDYVWLLAMAAICEEPEIAARVVDFGLSNPFVFGPFRLYFNFCNVCEEVVLHRSSWLGRQGQLVAHFRFATRRPTDWPAWWLRAWWGVVVGFSAWARQGNQDAWMHSWSLVHALPSSGLGWWIRLSRWWFLKRFRIVWPDGLSGPLALWLQDPTGKPWLAGEHHPLAVGWPAP